MKRIVCLFALTPMFGGVACADWKIVTRTGDRTVTEFFKGSRIRTDSPPAFTTVLDFERRRQISWRSDLRQYAVAEWPPVNRNLSPSDTVITIQRDTTDTGERKSFFGRAGRRLVTRVTRSDGPETLIDAWYIDAPGLPRWKNGAGGSFVVLTSFTAGQRSAPPRIEVRRSGPAPEGLAVRQKISSSMVLPDGSHRQDESVSEVTGLVEGTLPDQLFLPPEGYQRVASFPNTILAVRYWDEFFQAYWQKIENWFSGLF